MRNNGKEEQFQDDEKKLRFWGRSDNEMEWKEEEGEDGENWGRNRKSRNNWMDGIEQVEGFQSRKWEEDEERDKKQERKGKRPDVSLVRSSSSLLAFWHHIHHHFRQDVQNSHREEEKECQEVTHRWPILSWYTLCHTHIFVYILTTHMSSFSGAPFNTFLSLLPIS